MIASMIAMIEEAPMIASMIAMIEEASMIASMIAMIEEASMIEDHCEVLCSSVLQRPLWVLQMRILLTGGAGFIGSHVLLLLVKKYPKYFFVNLDRLDYCSCIENIRELDQQTNYQFVQGSINDASFVNQTLEKYKIDTIMHFAAQTHVDNSFGNSILFTETNVLGTHVLLEAAKQAGVSKFVHVSTDEVYGHGLSGDASHENSPLEPTNPQAATKAAAEQLVKAYHRSFQLPIIITRGNNVQGPHQQPEKIVPKFINQILNHRPLTLHGDGSNMRNYLQVEDVARAFDIILHKGQIGEIYNIGGTHELSNSQVATFIQKLMHSYVDIHLVKDRPFNDFRQPLTSNKLKDLGWTEEVTLEDGLSRTIDWQTRQNGRYNLDQCLLAHPKRQHEGLSSTQTK